MVPVVTVRHLDLNRNSKNYFLKLEIKEIKTLFCFPNMLFSLSVTALALFLTE